jgi:hypothetical protein
VANRFPTPLGASRGRRRQRESQLGYEGVAERFERLRANSSTSSLRRFCDNHSGQSVC